MTALVPELAEAPSPHIRLADIERFLAVEARYQDEHLYEEWESLWTEDGVYWVPAGDDTDPETHVSIIFDNRARIGTRVRQLTTGKRYAQEPPSRMRRIISNLEVLATEGHDTLVAANFILFEVVRGHRVTWAGRTDYRLRVVDGQVRMAAKTVRLVDNEIAVTSIGFLI
jgi:3-phenylpropionate/cinnamic acid dioxygenase small subunit